MEVVVGLDAQGKSHCRGN